MPWTTAHQAPLSMEFSRQKYSSWLPFPSPGNIPDPGIEPMFPAWQVDSLPVNHLGNPNETYREAEKCDPHKRYKQTGNRNFFHGGPDVVSNRNGFQSTILNVSRKLKKMISKK